MSAKVTVACKHPHGLVLRLFAMHEVDEPQPGGGTRTVKRASLRHDIAPVQIRGYLEKYPLSLPPAAKHSEYALTHGVDKEFFDAWMAQNADHPMVVNNLIFAHESAETVSAVARELSGTICGLEPIDPAKLKGKVTSYNTKPLEAA